MDEQYESGSPVTLFYSYAHEDEILRDELEKHLGLLQRQGVISGWHDRLIVPGTEWAHRIDDHLNEATIILLLISPDFLASDYCYNIEMRRALERHKQGSARVIPIILRPCDWHKAPFAHLQCLPTDGRPVTIWNNQDEAFLDITGGLRRVLEHLQTPSTRSYAYPLSLVNRQNRERLLKRVHTFWIKGVFEHSLHHTILIELGLQERPDAVANPWRLVMQEAEQPPHLLPAGTQIIQVYDEAEGALLILGEPGAGKTTLLLELARELLQRTEHNKQHPLPVIFNLSSWAQKRPPLMNWLIDELREKYQVPHAVAQTWIDTNQILPLLDGLDEIAQIHRTACVTAINTYHQEHNFLPIVVCSRTAEYLGQTARVELQSAVLIQPLTTEQIDDYLISAGEQLSSLREALHNDLQLQVLATTPLMLSILTFTYQERSVEASSADSLETRRQQIFETYVARMLNRRGATSRYTHQQTKRWLIWLACQLTQHDQTMFYLERMQPNWLPTERLSQRYKRFTARLISVIIFGLVGGLLLGSMSILSDNELLSTFLGTLAGIVYALVGGLYVKDQPVSVFVWSHASLWRGGLGFLIGGLCMGGLCGLLVLAGHARGNDALWFGSLVGACYGIGGGLIGSVVRREETAVRRGEIVLWSGVGLRRSLLAFLIFSLTGVLAVIVTAKPIPLSFGPLTVGVIGAIIVALVSRVFFGAVGKLEPEIRPAEVVKWSWSGFGHGLPKQIGKGLGYGLGGGLVYGLIFSLLLGPVIGYIFVVNQQRSPLELVPLLQLSILVGLLVGFAMLFLALIFGLVFGMILGLARGMTSGWSSTMLDTHFLMKPNQGIQNSLRNSILVGLIVGPCTAFLVGMILSVIFGWIDSLRRLNTQQMTIQHGTGSGWLALSVIGAVLSMLLSGGIACIQHSVFRLFLQRLGCLPWKCVPFLDYATERVLLSKVGGGYMFIHRLLQDHFASQNREAAFSKEHTPPPIEENPTTHRKK